MALRAGFGLPPMHFVICSNYGGLGDHIARLPALRWALETQPHVSFEVFWQDYIVDLMHVLMPPEKYAYRIRHLPQSKLEERANRGDKPAYIDFAPKGLYNSLHMNLVDHGYLTLTGAHPADIAAGARAPRDASKGPISLSELRGYPRVAASALPPPIEAIKALNGQRYVVVTPVATSATRTWLPDQIEQTAKGLKDRGYAVVLLGRTTPLDLGNGIKNLPKALEMDRACADVDLIDKLSLVECLPVLAGATACIGIDNGLLHLAETVNCPQVWGFTSVPARLRVPEGARAVSIEADVPCRGCQVETFYVRHDFRDCMYGDFNCLPTMTSTKFLSAFDLLIDSLKKT